MPNSTSSTRKFTEQMIERINIPKNCARRELSDAIVSGLGLRITNKGRKTFSVIYRVPGEGGLSSNGRLLSGKQHRITLGRWPIIGLKEAREKARELLKIASEGKDPRKLISEENHARYTNTFKSVMDRYIDLYAKPNQAAWKNTESCMRLHVLPVWGDRPLADITRSDIHELLDSLVQAKKIGVARETRKHIRALLNWAVEREIIQASPAANLKRKELGYPDDHGRSFSDQEIRAVWAGCKNIGYPFGTLVQLLALTGQRTGDWANAQWSEINFDDKLLEIPAGRYKTRRPHSVPLSPPVLNILESLPRWTQGDYIFTARSKSGIQPVVGFSKAMPRLERYAQDMLRQQLGDPQAVLEHYQIKDFRKTCRTRLTQLGVSEEVSEMVIGHTQAKIIRTYNRYAYVEEKREALDAYGDHIIRIVNCE